MAASYALYDFTESLARVPLDREDIKTVLRAVGESREGYSDWQGGFVLELHDGRHAFLFGWCDTTGWGCQDGAYLVYYDHEPTTEEVRVAWAAEMYSWPEEEWDETPADLNRWVMGEIEVW